MLEAQTWITVILNGLPWKWTKIIPLFLRLHPRTAFQTLLLIMRSTPSLLRDSYPQYREVKGAQSCLTLCDPMEFCVPEYWSGQPFPFPGDLPNPGIKPRSPTLQADSSAAEPQGSPRILEWVAYPFSSRSSWPRNWTRISWLQVDSLPAELHRMVI